MTDLDEEHEQVAGLLKSAFPRREVDVQLKRAPSHRMPAYVASSIVVVVALVATMVGVYLRGGPRQSPQRNLPVTHAASVSTVPPSPTAQCLADIGTNAPRFVGMSVSQAHRAAVAEGITHVSVVGIGNHCFPLASTGFLPRLVVQLAGGRVAKARLLGRRKLTSKGAR